MFFSFLPILKSCYGNPIITEINIIEKTLKIYASVCVSVSTSRVQLFATPRTIVCEAPLSMGFLRQEYWNGLLFPSPLCKCKALLLWLWSFNSIFSFHPDTGVLLKSGLWIKDKLRGIELKKTKADSRMLMFLHLFPVSWYLVSQQIKPISSN